MPMGRREFPAHESIEPQNGKHASRCLGREEASDRRCDYKSDWDR